MIPPLIVAGAFIIYLDADVNKLQEDVEDLEKDSDVSQSWHSNVGNVLTSHTQQISNVQENITLNRQAIQRIKEGIDDKMDELQMLIISTH